MPYLSAAYGENRLVFVFVQPIRGLAIVTVEPVFIFTSERHGIDEERRRLDSIPVEADMDLGIHPTYLLNPRG
jgi:hypothetical protein